MERTQERSIQRGSWLAEAGLVGWAGVSCYVVVIVAFWVTLKGRTLALRIPLGMLSMGTTIATIRDFVITTGEALIRQ